MKRRPPDALPPHTPRPDDDRAAKDSAGAPASQTPLLRGAALLSSGSLRLDAALGGGIPFGQMVELSGPPASSKTTLCLHIIAEAQRQGKPCAWVDADGTLDPHYAQLCGVDPDQLLISTPQHGEQALDIAHILLRTGGLGVVVVDSLTALTPRAELNQALSATQVAPEAATQRLLAKSLSRLDRAARATRTILIFTDQLQTRLSAAYHNLESEPERLALKLHAGLRLRLQPIAPLRWGSQVMGQKVLIKIIKNSFRPCFHTLELDIICYEGIMKSAEVLDLGTELLVVIRQGPVYLYRGIRLGDGRAQALAFLQEQPDLRNEIEQAVRQKLQPVQRRMVR